MAADYPKLGGWVQGMNTLLDKQELPSDTLRNAVNIDITNQGMLKRRRGSLRLLAANIARGSLWSNDQRTLFVESGSLKELYKSPSGVYSSILVVPDIGHGPVAYVEAGAQIYWTNGVFTGRIDAEGRDWPWGVTPPPRQPTLAIGGGGQLEPGTYQLAITFVAEDGEESGTGLAAQAVVPSAGGRIDLSNFPQPAESRSKIRVYCSYVNGEGLYWVGDMPSGSTQYAITRTSNFATVLLQTQFGIAPPAGTVLEAHNGRIYIGRDNVVWLTEPLRYGLVKPMMGFVQFPAPVTVIKSVDDGVFICSDRTYWLTDVDTDQMRLKDVLPYGAVFGTGMDIPKYDAVAWFGETGLVIGGLKGEVYNTLEDRVAVSRYGNGAMFWREDRGVRSIVATLRDGTITPYMTSDYVALETARGGNFI